MNCGDRTHELVPFQTDGGGVVLMEPTSLPDYPHDGPMRFEENYPRKLKEVKIMIRAKMQVTEIALNGYSERVKLNAVYGGDKNSEDNTFAQATPSASVEMQIDNPKAQGQMKPGMKFYVDFTPVPEPVKT